MINLQFNKLSNNAKKVVYVVVHHMYAHIHTRTIYILKHNFFVTTHHSI
jgi:hypothetical protein